MASHRKRGSRLSNKLIAACAFISLASLGGVATIAGFTNNATSPVSVKSGFIDITAGGVESFAVDFGSTWKPGDTVTKTIAMRNAGTLPLSYKTTTTATGAGVLAKKLDVVVKSNTVQTFAGKLNAINATPVTLTAGQSHNLTLTLTWPHGADDDTYQNTSGNIVVTFSATQT